MPRVLLGARLWLIAGYGNATPYWDQWSGEAELLYKPFLQGKLGLADLLAPANEHRILTTRLLDLTLLTINGIWNPLLQMAVNAALHVATLCLFVALLAPAIGRQHLPVLLAFAAVVFAVPYAWENTLWGYQCQFYFVILFSIACLWLTVTHPPFSTPWWAGAACAVLAYFSFGSGIFAPAAAALLGLLLYVRGTRRTAKQLLAAAILGSTAMLGLMLTPSLANHECMKAASFFQFLEAWMKALGWPVSGDFWGALLVVLPGVVLGVVMLRKRPSADDRRWFLLALVVWTLMQTAGIAYARAPAPRMSRYQDLFALGVMANFACALALVRDALPRRLRFAPLGAALWAAAILLCLAVYADRRLPAQLSERRDTARAQESNVRAYLATGDFRHLADKPRFHVPYPESEPLAAFLAPPEIRAILPANLRFDGRTGRLDWAVAFLLADYHVFPMLGLVAVLALAAQCRLSSRSRLDLTRLRSLPNFTICVRQIAKPPDEPALATAPHSPGEALR